MRAVMSLLFLLLPAILDAGRVLDGELFRFDFSEMSGNSANDSLSQNLVGNLLLTPGVTWSTRSVGLNFSSPRTAGLSSSKDIAALMQNITAMNSFTLEAWIALKPSTTHFRGHRSGLALGMPMVDDDWCNGNFVSLLLEEKLYAGTANLSGVCASQGYSPDSTVQQQIHYIAIGYGLIFGDPNFGTVVDTNLDSFFLSTLPIKYNSSYHLLLGPAMPALPDLLTFEGIIYQVAMYNRLLSFDEFRQNYNAWIANSPPYAQNATIRVYENLKQILQFTYYDFDVENGRQNDTIFYTLHSLPSKGRMFLNGGNIQLMPNMLPLVLNNSVQYIAGLNDYGDNYTSFSFSANDGNRAGPIAYIRIDVEFVNQPPVALPQEYALYGEPTMLTLGGTDVENGTNLHVAVITRLPMNGILFQSDGVNFTVPITNISDPYDCLTWANRTNITCQPNGLVLNTNLTLFYLPVNFSNPSQGTRIIGTDNFAYRVGDGTNFSLNEADVYIDILNPLQTSSLNVSNYQERRASHQFPGTSRFGDPYAVVIISQPINGTLYQLGSNVPITTFPVTLNAPNGSRDIVDYAPKDGLYGEDPPLEQLIFYLTATNPLKPFRSANATMNISVIPINHPPTMTGNNTARVVPMLTDQPLRLTLTDQDPPIQSFTFNMTSLKGICKVKPYPKVVKFLIFGEGEGDGDYQVTNVYNASQYFATLSVLRFYYRCFETGSDTIFINVTDNGGFPITPAYDVQWTINITSYREVIALPSTVHESPEMVVAWIITGFVPIACLCCIAYKQCNNRYKGYKPQPEGDVELDGLQSPQSPTPQRENEDLHAPVVRDPTVISREGEEPTTPTTPTPASTTNGHTLSHASVAAPPHTGPHAPPPRTHAATTAEPAATSEESTRDNRGPMVLQLPILTPPILRPIAASTASTTTAAPAARVAPPITPRGRGATTSSQAPPPTATTTVPPPVSSRDRGDTTSSTLGSLATPAAAAHASIPPSPRSGPPPSPRPVAIAPPAPPPRAAAKPAKSSWRRYSTDDGTGKYYFYNKQTNESVWVTPTDFDPERDVDSDTE